MLVYILFCPVFLLSTTLVLTTSDVQQPSETVIADVIKNISRVNNILQELIHNYEHLQKIYKSQENLDITSDYPLFRDDKKTSDVKTNRTIHSDQLLATEMVWSDIDEEETSEITLHIKGITKTPQPTSKMNRHQHFKPTTKKKATTENEMLILLSSAETTVQTNVTSKKTKLEVKFINTHKKRLNKEEKKKTVAPDTTIYTEKKKTRFSIEPNREIHRHRDKENLRQENVNNTTKAKKKHKRQKTNKSGEGKRGKSAIETGPLVIKLSLGNNKKSDERSKKQKNGDKSLIILSSGMYKEGAEDVEPKNITNTKKSFSEVVKKEDNQAKEEIESQSSDDVSENNESIMKDVFKTSVLRKAYGDACLKLVLRKCYKACQTTLKIICSSSKCKSAFKGDFKKNYKEKCDSVFADMMYRAMPSPDDADGNLAAVCLPLDKSLPIAVKEETNSDKKAAATKNLNVLRAKYEQACVKSSRERCSDACKYAFTQACAKHECSSSRLRAFEKTCKRQCKISYVSEKGSKKSSESSSSSSSSSESSS